MLTFDPPAELNGVQLEQELAAAGLPATVFIEGGSLMVTGTEDHVSVAAVIAAHVPAEAEPVPPVEERLAALEATVDQLLNGGLG